LLHTSPVGPAEPVGAQDRRATRFEKPWTSGRWRISGGPFRRFQQGGGGGGCGEGIGVLRHTVRTPSSPPPPRGRSQQTPWLRRGFAYFVDRSQVRGGERKTTTDRRSAGRFPDRAVSVNRRLRFQAAFAKCGQADVGTGRRRGFGRGGMRGQRAGRAKARATQMREPDPPGFGVWTIADIFFFRDSPGGLGPPCGWVRRRIGARRRVGQVGGVGAHARWQGQSGKSQQRFRGGRVWQGGSRVARDSRRGGSRGASWSAGIIGWQGQGGRDARRQGAAATSGGRISACPCLGAAAPPWPREAKIGGGGPTGARKSGQVLERRWQNSSFGQALRWVLIGEWMRDAAGGGCPRAASCSSIGQGAVCHTP